MNFLDRAISFFSPSWGYKREAWRRALGTGGYDGARFGRNNSTWHPLDGTGEMVNRGARKMLRTRARDLERNSDVTGAIINALERNVVGHGFNFQAETEDEKFNDLIEQLWKEWQKPRNCDVTGQQSFREILKMAVDRIVVDGGIIIVKTYTGNPRFPLQLQCRDIDDLNAMGMIKNPDTGNLICDGIELDKYNKPVAYYLTSTNANGMINPKPVRVEAQRIIYLWKKKRPSEYREISGLSRIMDRIHDLYDYMKSVGFMQKILASICVFIKRTLPDVMPSIGRNPQQKTPDGTPTQRIRPGEMFSLAPGEDVSTLVPSGQAAEAAAYCTHQERMAAASCGLSLEATARDVSQVNYSSARQNLLADDATYSDWQMYLIEHCLDEVLSEFVISCWLAGTILPKVTSINELKDKYMIYKFIPQGMPWIDPVKEATGNKILMETGQTTLRDICSKSGKDWKEVLRQLAAEKKMKEELGILEVVSNGQKNVSN